MPSAIRAKLTVLSVALGFLLALAGATALAALDPAPAEAADTVSVRSCTGGTVELKSGERRLLVLINRARARRDLSMLCVHLKLERAARSHSRDMMQNDYFSHYSRGGSEDPGERIARFGYDWASYGETIDWGYGAAAGPLDAFKHWMRKKPHRRLILNRHFREVGVGAVYGTFAPDRDHVYRDAVMWTVDFGTRR